LELRVKDSLESLMQQMTLNNGWKQGEILCIANTHIMANPNCTDIKIWQVYTLIRILEQITNMGSIPLILAGDFNSTPSSGVYQLIINRQLNQNHPDLKDLSLES